MNDTIGGFLSFPYMCGLPSNVFLQVNWDTALANIEVTFGGPQVPRRPKGMKP